MSTIFLSLGSNMGDRGAYLQKALVELEQWGVQVVRSSSIYQTEPVGNKNQSHFLNMVVQCLTVKSPEDLLMIIHAVERSLGRVRSEKWGPRTIDIDVLFYDEAIVHNDDLVIPHSYISERKFVLVPLNEIAPHFVHPVLKKTVGELLRECKDFSKVELN